MLLLHQRLLLVLRFIGIFFPVPLSAAYRCCGESDGYAIGYTSWRENDILRKRKGVPDSCCIRQKPDCGKNLFDEHYNVKVVATHAHDIFVHGCMSAIKSVLEVRGTKLYISSKKNVNLVAFLSLFFQNQIMPILLVFSIVGALLAMLELLGIVLACALSHVIRRVARQRLEEEARARQANMHLALKSGDQAAGEVEERE